MCAGGCYVFRTSKPHSGTLCIVYYHHIRCGQGRHPLMHAIKAVLGPAREAEEVTQQEQEMVVERDKEADQADNTDDDEDNTVLDGGDGDESNDVLVDEADDEVADAGHKVVCYFTNWAWYRPQGGKYQPRDIQADLCTHIVYGFAVLDPDTLTIKPHDTWADFDNGQLKVSIAENINNILFLDFYKQVTALKSKKRKVLLAIGGWNDSEGDKYSRLVNSGSSRAAFVQQVASFLLANNFDGLDLDWEYPKCWQVDCSLGPDQDKRGFAELIKELHFAFKPKGCSIHIHLDV